MYVKRILPNGVRLITERIDNMRTVSVGIWVGNGSRYEPAELGGVSHFIEHMIFKGTEKRSARHIAIAIDALGGQANAFTDKECTMLLYEGSGQPAEKRGGSAGGYVPAFPLCTGGSGAGARCRSRGDRHVRGALRRMLPSTSCSRAATAARHLAARSSARRKRSSR